MSKQTDTENKAQLNWKKAKNIVMQAIRSPGSDLVDSVRVRISNQYYLQELAQGKHIDKNRPIEDQEILILKMSPEELNSRKLTYDGDVLIKSNGEIADTSGQRSKGKPGQIFVMSKEGDIFTGTHGETNTKGEKIVHGSFLSDRPAEMAGMIEIRGGKIISISNNSGHYAPDELDMYRGASKLIKTMPNAFTKDCKIEIGIQKGKERTTTEENLTSFTSRMEALDQNGKPHHQNLRDKKIQSLIDSKENLYDQAKSMKRNQLMSLSGEEEINILPISEMKKIKDIKSTLKRSYSNTESTDPRQQDKKVNNRSQGLR